MSEKYQDSLKSICRSFSKTEDSVFDIVLYGSAIRASSDPRDVDMAVIFNNISLKDRMPKIIQLKKRLKKIVKNIDLKSMDLLDLFDADHLARQGILIDGKSMLDGKAFSEKLGFRGKTIFSYSLDGLTHTQKIRFNYSLRGRNTEGVLESVGGKTLGRGVVSIPAKRSDEFEEYLGGWNIKFSKRRCLEEFY